jgi:competence protein ComGC
MTIIYTIIAMLVTLNVILALGIRNLLKQNEELEDTLLETMTEVKTKVTIALDALKDADLKGSFESDDEVGVVFKEMKEIVENLNEII